VRLDRPGDPVQGACTKDRLVIDQGDELANEEEAETSAGAAANPPG